MTRIEVDVLVVGGGPAGLAAAAEVATRGGRVLLVEREDVTGGVPRHCAHSPFGMREFGRVLSGGDYGARLTDRANQAGAEIKVRHSVTALNDGVATIVSPEGALDISARRILIATGIRESSRAARLLGGQRPLGVITTGALQDYVHLRGLVPFRRPVILGSELVTMSSLLTCRGAGIRPVAVIEDEASPRVGRPIALFPTLLGIPVHYRTTIDEIIGAPRVEAVRVRHADGTQQVLECDGVLLTGRFTPESSLARLSGVAIDPATGGPVIDASGRSSIPSIFAAGNVRRGVKTAGHCWSEGRASARAILADLEAA